MFSSWSTPLGDLTDDERNNIIVDAWQHAISTARTAGRHDIAAVVERISFHIDPRRARRAGFYRTQDNSDHLNLFILRTPSDLRQTTLHEIAHAMAWSDDIKDRVPGQDVPWHGRRWCYWMSMLGVPSDRCHTIDTKALMPEKYVRVRCEDGGTASISWVMYRKIQRGERRSFRDPSNPCKGYLTTQIVAEEET